MRSRSTALLTLPGFTMERTIITIGSGSEGSVPRMSPSAAIAARPAALSPSRPSLVSCSRNASAAVTRRSTVFPNAHLLPKHGLIGQLLPASAARTALWVAALACAKTRGAGWIAVARSHDDGFLRPARDHDVFSWGAAAPTGAFRCRNLAQRKSKDRYSRLLRGYL